MRSCHDDRYQDCDLPRPGPDPGEGAVLRADRAGAVHRRALLRRVLRRRPGSRAGPERPHPGHARAGRLLARR